MILLYGVDSADMAVTDGLRGDAFYGAVPSCVWFPAKLACTITVRVPFLFLVACLESLGNFTEDQALLVNRESLEHLHRTDSVTRQYVIQMEAVCGLLHPMVLPGMVKPEAQFRPRSMPQTHCVLEAHLDITLVANSQTSPML